MATVILPFNHPQFLLATPKNTIEVLSTAHLWRNQLGNTNVLSGLEFVGGAGTVINSNVIPAWVPLTDDSISSWSWVDKPLVPEIEVVLPVAKNIREVTIFMRNIPDGSIVKIFNNAVEDLLFSEIAAASRVRAFSPEPEGQSIKTMRILFDYDPVEISEIKAFDSVYPAEIISLIHREPTYGTTFSAFSAVSTIPANTRLEYIIHVNNTRYWHDGNKWTPNGNILRFDRTNTEAEVNANIDSINTTTRQIRLDVEVLLQTNDEYATPDITSVSLEVA